MSFAEAQRGQYTEDGKPPVAWERYLEVAPEVAGLDADALEEALGARGLDPALWKRAESYWLLTLALDAQRGQLARVEAYGVACASARRPGSAAVAYAPPPAPVAAVRAPETTRAALPVHREAPLPFGPKPSPEYAARLAGPAPASVPVSSHRPDATVIAASKRAEPTLPFAAGPASADKPAPRVPDMTVEQHAKLSAELALGFDPARRAEILARHGIESPEALTRLGAEWQSRLGADAAAGERWRAAYARHRAELQQQSQRR
jgi:hypothetical protein